MDKKTKLRLKLWLRDACKLILLLLLAPFLGLGVYAWIFSQSTHEEISQAGRAIQYIGSMNRAQHVHFFETGDFTDNFAELGINPVGFDHYKFATKITKDVALID